MSKPQSPLGRRRKQPAQRSRCCASKGAGERNVHGKRVLAEFYKEHLHSAGLSKVVFTFETAMHTGRRAAVTAFFNTLFDEVAPEHASPRLRSNDR
jgi:hypothetical protein